MPVIIRYKVLTGAGNDSHRDVRTDGHMRLLSTKRCGLHNHSTTAVFHAGSRIHRGRLLPVPEMLRILGAVNGYSVRSDQMQVRCVVGCTPLLCLP